VTKLASDFGLPVNRIEQALLGLQSEGYVMSMDSVAIDSVAPDSACIDAGAELSHPGVGLKPGQPRLWCERRLLARIHRYSREKRRQSRSAVTPASFMRFLIAWHGLESPGHLNETRKTPNTHDAGGLSTAMAALEGWAAPLSAWETELLQSRCHDYNAQALDQLFLSGQWAWFRPGQGASDRQQIISATPIALVPRQALSLWQEHADDSRENLPDTAAAILELLQQKGAMFTADLMPATGVLQPQLEQALGLLVARGLITADAFSPLRWLARTEQEKRRKLRFAQRSPGRGTMGQGMLGRWSLFNPSGNTGNGPDQNEIAQICAALLKRYGVVFRTLLERETLLPPWRDLLRYFRRLEDRGEVMGGRFVDGFSGEQFALAEAAGLLRNLDQRAASGKQVVISACDPLNLGGIITPGVKTPAINGYRILLKEGIPVARMQGEKIEVLDPKLESRSEQLRLQLSPLRHLHRHEA
jgi:ATP-dependent Lhr-like helicase